MTTMYQVQAGIAKDIRALFAALADQIGGIILRAGGVKAALTRRQSDSIKSGVNSALDGVFVGADGRQPYAADGITPLAAYPRVVNTHLKGLLDGIVTDQQKYMKTALPDNVQRWLTAAQPATIGDYEPPHSWVSPGGHNLSDLIWRNDLATRMKLDQLISDGIRRGLSPEDLARQISGMVRGDRRYITSVVDGANIPYDALRLARTTIAAANGQALIAAVLASPVAAGIDWQLSIKHTDTDHCDQIATLDGRGNRRKPAYSPKSLPRFPDHPNCLCGLVVAYQVDQAAIDRILRAHASGAPAPFTPLSVHFSDYLLGTKKGIAA